MPHNLSYGKINHIRIEFQRVVRDSLWELWNVMHFLCAWRGVRLLH
jgi:hypothetical protein